MSETKHIKKSLRTIVVENTARLHAALLMLFALAFAFYYLNPFLAIVSEAKDMAFGVYGYCGSGEGSSKEGETCVSFVWERWLQGIGGGMAALGLLYAFSQAAVAAWNGPRAKYVFEFEKKSVLALSASGMGLGVSFLVEAWKWGRLFVVHENALFNLVLAAASFFAAKEFWRQARHMSKGEALSVELHRHTQF